MNTAQALYPAHAHILQPDIQWWVSEAIRDQQTKVFAVTAGLGAGKTHGAIQWHYDRCALNWESPFSAIMLPTYQKIYDSAIPKTRDVLNSFGFTESIHYRIVKTPFPKCILKATGQEIHYISADRPDRIVAVEYSHTTIDEAGSIKEDAARFIRTRIRCRKAQCRQLIFSGVPQGLGWMSEQFDSAVNPGWESLADRDDYFPSKSFRRFRLTTYDNPFLPDDYAENILDTFSGNKNIIQSYIYGHFKPFSVGNCYEFEPSRDIVSDVELSPNQPIYLCFDFNHHPLAWTALQRQMTDNSYRRYPRYVVCREASGEETHLSDACAEFIIKVPPDKYKHTPIHIYGDNSGWNSSHKMKGSDYEALVKYLRPYYHDVQIKASHSNIRIRQSVNTVNKFFLYEYLVISKECDKTIKSFMNTTFKQGTWELEKPGGELVTHWSDSIRPAMMQFASEFDFEKPMAEKIYGLNF